MRTGNKRPFHQRLTPTMEKVLVRLLGCQQFEKGAGSWHDLDTGMRIRHAVIEALYERNLLMVVVDKRFARKHFARLTEIGVHVARDILHQESRKEVLAKVADSQIRRGKIPVNEKSSLLITEVTQS